jgi:hypothetical protein
MMTIELNPALRPVAFLLGTWLGEGSGQYPTVQPFRYREEIRFSHTGKTFLVYTQRTEAADDGRPLHAEMGYLRLVGGDQAELVIAQPTGYAEIEVGTIKGNRIDLESIQVARTPTAKPVTAVARSFWLDGELLHYELRMAMSNGPLVLHLAASFRRAGEPG